ncbi:hypothetical protein SASPL_134519 [Salvia splendens]|uniref:Uncharacterized protein n=1 Tax=Salvia splendens TaxID=180675 RepID=A0A8X8ZJ43_SALSN|nr:hypothetical protein SASPL_134519 [Salvia splendens]
MRFIANSSVAAAVYISDDAYLFEFSEFLNPGVIVSTKHGKNIINYATKSHGGGVVHLPRPGAEPPGHSEARFDGTRNPGASVLGGGETSYEKQSYSLRIAYAGNMSGVVASGEIIWVEENGVHKVRSPIVVAPMIPVW